MKTVRRFALAVTFLSLVFGCGSDGNDNIYAGGFQGVRFLEKGAVVPDPISTTVSINPGFIKYSQSQSEQKIGGWVKQIQFADYTSVRRIIADNKLYESGDVHPTGMPPCLGAQGMTISILMNNGIHSFDIDGSIYCDRSQWPAGVRELVNLEETLVLKYK